MARPVTLFTGQWADLSLDDLAKMAKGFGYDGLELACWGDHFEVDKATAHAGYCKKKRELLENVARLLLDKEVMEGEELRAMMGLPQNTDQASTMAVEAIGRPNLT